MNMQEAGRFKQLEEKVAWLEKQVAELLTERAAKVEKRDTLSLKKAN